MKTKRELNMFKTLNKQNPANLESILVQNILKKIEVTFKDF